MGLWTTTSPAARRPGAVMAFVLRRTVEKVLSIGWVAMAPQSISQTLIARSAVKRGHNPARSKLAVSAGEWFARYGAGYDVTR